MRATASVAALLAVLAPAFPRAAGELVVIRSIALPQVEGRIDHLAFDAAHQRLYVAALGNNTVEVIDAAAGAHLRSLSGFHEPQGIAVAADVDVVAVANGQGDGIQFVKSSDLTPGASVRLGDDSDNVRYDASAKRLYVGFGDGAIAAVDPGSGKVLGEAKLAAHPESFQLERSGTRIFVNVPNARHIAVIDRNSMTVTATWPISTAAANFPMALDEENHRLFVGCRHPAKVLVFDTATGKEVGSADSVGDTDDLFYDAPAKRLLVSGGEGYLDALQDQGDNHFARVARTATASGARTCLYVADQRRLYLAVPHRGSQQAEIRIYDVR
jgi:DNA-binding beta-propeller fold protein YncE